MPQVIIESPFDRARGRDLVLECPRGGRLVDLCDERSAPVPFSCRGGTCGTCLIDVTEGMHLLEDPSPHELDLLSVLDEDPSRRRLACQSVARAAPGLIRIRAVITRGRG